MVSWFEVCEHSVIGHSNVTELNVRLFPAPVKVAAETPVVGELLKCRLNCFRLNRRWCCRCLHSFGNRLTVGGAGCRYG